MQDDGYQTSISQLDDRGVMSTSLVIRNVKQADIRAGFQYCDKSNQS